MKILKAFGWWLWIVPILLSVWSGSTEAKPEFSKKESKACTYCHLKTGDKELNAAGKYYKEHNLSLEGYKEPPATK